MGAREGAALAVGFLFGIGLCLSQMANPEKVLAFLNVAGQWDPSLLLVMLGATAVAFAGYRWALRRPPVLARRHHLPEKGSVDRRLLAGAAIFGIGWGLAGYCPGPALTGLASGSAEPPLFVLAMLAGSFLASRRPFA